MPMVLIIFYGDSYKSVRQGDGKSIMDAYRYYVAQCIFCDV